MFSFISQDIQVVTIAYELSLIDKIERKDNKVFSIVVNKNIEDVLNVYNYQPLRNFYILSLQ